MFESDFEFNGQAKPRRILQLLQDEAVEHASQLGFGWDALNERGMLWVLSKINLVFDTPVTRENGKFSLYTWPLAPGRFYVERCFAAIDENGRQLFSAISLWLIIDREQRRIVPAQKILNDIYDGVYSDVRCDAQADFARIRKDENFEFCYERQIMRSDLDKNGHVNNTNYANYALDVLPPQEIVNQLEIVYDKELKLHDKILISTMRIGKNVYVVGEREGTTCFSALLSCN